MDKLLNIETHASASFDATYNNDNNNNQARDDPDVAAPKVLFSPNDQDDMTQQLDQDSDDTSLEGEEIEEEIDDLLDDEDDSTQTNLDPDAMDLNTTVDGTDESFDTDDGASVALDEDDNSGLGSDSHKVNVLGEDMEDSIFDSPARINLETDETQEGSVTADDELQELQQEQQQEEEEDETVEKTWDMAGDDVDDDQENSSVDALLDAGEDSLDDDNTNIDNVINDDTFVVDELAETKVDESTTGKEGGGQHTWNNDNIELTGSSDSTLEDDSPQTWNSDDDVEAEVEDEQEETMEQGTVEESENDRLGATLEHALDALEIEQDTTTTTSSPVTIDSGNNIIVDDASRTDDRHGFKDNGDTVLPLDDSVGKSAPLSPPQQQQQTTTIGSDSTDELASVDTSLVLLIAVFILLCLRLPYVKRFFVKLFKSQESTTLPYHTAHSKELD